jgi:predicted RNA-binding protein with EMAP domain
MPPDEELNETPPETPTPEPPPNSGKTFTQDQVNTLLAEEKRKGQKANEKTIRQLEELKKSGGFSVEDKQQLENRIEELKTEYMTKEELSKREQDKLKREAKKAQEDLAKERDNWKERYTNYAIEQDIYNASHDDAYNPLQIINLLRPMTRLVEELDDDNKPTGRLISKVRLSGKDKSGNIVTLDLAPPEAIQQMKEMPEHGNLFKSGAHSGVGGVGSPGITPKNGPPVDDTVAYRAWRKTAGLGRK